MRRIHIIAQDTSQSDGYVHGTVALWLDTPATMVAANPARTSRVPWATPVELQAIQAGTVTEMVDTAKVPLTDPASGASLPVATLNALIMANGRASLPAAQAALDAIAPPAVWVGVTYEDTTDTWTGLPS